MRLVRFGPRGLEKPGLWKDDRIVDLRKIFPEIRAFPILAKTVPDTT